MRALVLAGSVAIVAAGAVWPAAGDEPALPGPVAVSEPALPGAKADSEPPPTATPRPWGRPVYVQVDADLAIEACEGLAPVIGTRPTPLVGCVPWQACQPCVPGRADTGQVFILWPSVFRYRVYRPGDEPTSAATAPPSPAPPTATPEPEAPPACAPVYVVVTATPTDTLRPTETMELTPTAVPTTGTWWPLVLQRRRGRW